MDLGALDDGVDLLGVWLELIMLVADGVALDADIDGIETIVGAGETYMVADTGSVMQNHPVALTPLV